MPNAFVSKHHRLIFYAGWLILGLIQAAFTELQDDEAYYWVYANYIDWGYFDHPPMIGLLVKIGYAIFPNELGVRLIPLLLNLFSLLVIENLTRKKDPPLFYTIALSITVLQLVGFVAVPDTPLIFFTALFFYCYKKFVDKPSLKFTLLLGLSIALLFYSKYHAVLIVFFTLLSNLKLLTRYQAWLAAFVALIAFGPHLWWQYEHDWVSFRYHLFESNVNAYKPSFTLDYIVGQLLLPGPIAGFILLPAAFLYKPADNVERALKWTTIGIYGFFLLSSFRGKVEGNWTSPALVGLFILSHQYLTGKLGWRKILVRLLPLSVLLVVFARIVMMVDILPVKEIQRRYHAWKKWPKELNKKTEGLPIIFSNSYQRASKYWFYSGQPTYSLNHYRERKNNYNIWSLEDSLLGKRVYYFDIYDLERFVDSIQTPSIEIGWRPDSFFVSFAKIHVKTNPAKLVAITTDSIRLDCSFVIPEHYAAFIKANQQLIADTTRVGVFNSKGWIKDINTDWKLIDLVDKPDQSIQFHPSLPKGEYYLRIAISAGLRNPTHNSDKIPLTVND